MKCKDCDGTGEKFILPRGNPFNMKLPQLAQAMRKVSCYQCKGTGTEPMSEQTNSEVQVSYDLARENNDLTVATITRVFENGFKVLATIEGEDAEAFIDAWNTRAAP